MPELPSLRDTVVAYGLLAKKSLGQNFLLDMNITRKIIRASLSAQGKESFAGEEVFEVGPGPGGLTRAILESRPQRLTVIEMDARCIEIMRDLQAATSVCMQIIEGDALQYDFCAADIAKKNIVSNLPYNISVPLLLKWLENMAHFSSLTLMFQKEVAERIMAKPDNKNYGRLSVAAQLACRIEPLLTLKPSCFVPAPKVMSTVLLFLPADEIPDAEVFAKVGRLTEKAFGQRRKMLRQSLKGITGIEDACRQLEIDMSLRAENLAPEQYLHLAEILHI